MTEAKWLASKHPQRMVEFLRDRASDRQLRLVGCACCRLIWDRLTDPRSRRAVEVAEHFADERASIAELRAAGDAAQVAASRAGGTVGADWASPAAAARVTEISLSFANALLRDAGILFLAAANDLAARGAQCAAIRDISGNPFRPVSLTPAWRTTDVLALARGIYDERAFDRMPILADALQDADCTNDDVLNHCRAANQVHVRGCWVLDLVLGKT